MVVAEQGVTLGSLLATPGFGLVLVAGPADPGRVLRWAHSTDLLCPARYLRGGELVLTVGSALTSAEHCEAFVRELVSAHARALGLGVGDIHDEVPAALRQACDVHGLPLLSVPYGVPFQALTELLAEHRVVERLAGVRRTGALVATVLDAMACPGAPVDALGLLAAELGGQLLVVDDQGVVEAAAGPEHGDGPAHAVDLPGGPSARLVWLPLEEVPAATALDTLHQLAHPVALWRHERVESMLRAERDLGRLLGLVLDGMAEPRALVRSLGPSGQRELTASAWPLRETVRLRALLPDAPRAVVEDAMVVLLAEPAHAHALAAAHGLACGTGRRVPVHELTLSVREALAALALSLTRGRPVAATELATLDALLDRLPEAALSPFIDQLLRPLVEHDRRAGSQLVASLRAFVEGGGSMVPTARTLFVHPNTLRHRMARVAEISGRDPLDWHDRVAFTIALRTGQRQRRR